jgi:hypothetical protein
MEQLFKIRVLQDKIKTQNRDILQERWNNFQNFLSKKEQIKEFKEEKYQDGFLEDIFMNCLGYTLDTKSSDFNLEREKKNATDSKKADGAITVNGNVVGVIELKGQDTKKFETKGKNVIEQAFGYLTSHNRKYAHYVIISNFDLLRFYIDDKLNYQEYSLFNLTYEQFEELHYLLCYENIKQDIPLKLKEQQSNHQDNISNEIYKQYSRLRVQLFNNLIDKNETIDKNVLLVKTQKILDRMIFIFFAEDRGIIPSDTIDKIIEQFKNDYRHEPLFEHYKIYFDAINRGNDRLNISAYNGGLFDQERHAVLTNIRIPDAVMARVIDALSFENTSEGRKYINYRNLSVQQLGSIYERLLEYEVSYDGDEITVIRDIKRLDALQNLSFGPTDLFVAFADIPLDGIGQGRCLLAFRLSFERVKRAGSRKSFLAVLNPGCCCRSALESLALTE